MKHYLSVFFLFLLSFGAQGALNKWVDAQGNVHYSDEPPPQGVNAGILNVPQPGSGVLPQKSFLEREKERQQAQKTRSEEERNAAGQQDGEQARREVCDTLLANLATLKDSPGIVTLNAKGEEVVMNAAERKRQTEETHRQLEKLECAGQ